LFEIVGALDTPLGLDEVTKKRNFSHFSRVLIELDLTSNLRERILVQRKDFDFYVDFEYEKLPPFCNSCEIVGHSLKNYKYQIPPKMEHVKPGGSIVEKVDVLITPHAGTFQKNVTCYSKTVVEIDSLINDISRSKEIVIVCL